MALWTLDVVAETDVDSFEQAHDLDGRTYVLRFDWNERDEAWRMTIRLPDDTVLAAGRKVVVNVPLLRGLVDSRLPAGTLMAIDNTGQDLDPAHDELGVRVQIVYVDTEGL